MRGRDGLELARSSKPDLVLLDLMLPGLDGLQLCRAIRADANTAAIPIIILTARGEVAGGDAEVVCAGVDGTFTIDDAYCAGRIAELLGGERSDAAEAAVRLARSFGTAEEALRAAENPRQEAILDDIAWCARESVLDVVPRVDGSHGPAVVLRT